MKGWIIRNVTQREIRDVHKKQIKIINRLEPDSVLDVAPSQEIYISSETGCKYTSIGLPEKWKHFARAIDKKHNLDIYPYPVPDKSYDMVLMSNILEHLKEPWRAVSEGKRIARKWLLIVLPMPVGFSAPDIEFPHRHFWADLEGIERFLAKCGITKYKKYHTYSRSDGKYLPRFMRRFLANWKPKRFSRDWFFLVKVI